MSRNVDRSAPKGDGAPKIGNHFLRAPDARDVLRCALIFPGWFGAMSTDLLAANGDVSAIGFSAKAISDVGGLLAGLFGENLFAQVDNHMSDSTNVAH